VLKKLDELQLTDNTLVVLTSDNGGYGPATSMEPLRGAKGMLYEGGVRVPLVVRWPGHTRPGSRSDAPVISIDFYPTLLEAADAPRPDQPLDGESLAPLLEQTGKLRREAIYWHFPAYLQAYRGAKGHWRTTPAGAMRQGDWKLIEYFEDGRLELYNLADDLGEQRNLAAQMPKRTRRMREQMQAWRAKLHAPVPTEKNPRYDPAPREKK
jgi:arylsulfatase A-like enzyme